MPEPTDQPRRARPRPARRIASPLGRRRRPDAETAPTMSPPEQAAPVASGSPESAPPESAPPESARPGLASPASAPPLRTPPTSAARRRLGRALQRPGRGQVIAAVILFVVGVGGVMQLRLNSADDAYTNARREDLIQILDGLGEESRRLESETTELQRTRTELETGANAQQVARQETERRLEQLSVLGGTAPAVGPGIRITIEDPAGKVGADVVLDAVEEMRDAGAEVIEVNDRVRVVADSWFADQNGQIVVDDVPVSRPVSLEVIGDPAGLEEAARFRGGLVSEITGPRINGRVQIEQLQKLEITSLHSQRRTQYAQPSSVAPSPR